MPARQRYTPKQQTDQGLIPFETAEDAWFWFIQAQTARAEGARLMSGETLYPRPCEPVDVFRVMEHLHRQRRLVMDHLLVMRHYGRRLMAPDPRRPKEYRAYKLWVEAMERMEERLVSKGIVARKVWRLPSVPPTASCAASATAFHANR